MKTAIVGTGYVGLVTGTCFAEMGANVICVDVDRTKIEKLKNGIIPIYEPGLEELVKKNCNDGRLNFTTDLASCINDVDIVFSAVGTPPDEDGSADLSYVLEVARTIGRTMNKYLLVVTVLSLWELQLWCVRLYKTSWIFGIWIFNLTLLLILSF